MGEIIGLLDQKSFKWYELSPDVSTIKNLEEIMNKVKSNDTPDFLADREDLWHNYEKLVGSKWVYTDNKNDVFAVIICRKKQTEVMVLKDNKNGKNLIKELEGLFDKNF